MMRKKQHMGGNADQTIKGQGVHNHGALLDNGVKPAF